MKTVVLSRLLIDGTGNPPIPGGRVLIEGSAIVAAGPQQEVAIPPGAEVIDCSKETVLPGLIEAHSHPANCGSNRFKRKVMGLQLQHTLPPLQKHLRMYKNCLDDMSAGITTIRCLGTDDDSDLALRDLIGSGELQGPRIVASGIPIRPSHGTAAFLGKAVDGVEGVRKAVRESFAKGADVIKAFATNVQAGTGDIAYRSGDLTCVPAYTKEELLAICEEAHNAGIKVAAHAIGGPALRWAMEAGADSVEHVNLIEERDIEVFLRTGCVLSDPNLYLFFDKEYGFESRPAWKELPAWWQKKVYESKERTRVYQRQAYQAGVKFALALDSGHGLIWREAKCMVDVLGASAMDVLLSLTSNTARLCGLENLGTIQAGKTADLISVQGNPLDDITCLKNVKLIMKEGKRFDGMLANFIAMETAAFELQRAVTT
jgi:imidazolonepropionase-like amidohydrolase